MKKYLSSAEVMEKFGVSRTTLYRWDKMGLPYIKMGRIKKYEELVVDSWIRNVGDGISDLIVGEIYDNDSIVKAFKCANMGGMRKSNTTNTMVLFSDHTGIYDDRWIDETTIEYTGTGQEGDQSLTTPQNKILSESNFNGVRIHLFETFESGKHLYRGEVELCDKPFQEVQQDRNLEDRLAWVFRLKLKTPTSTPLDYIKSVEESKLKQASQMTIEELQKRAENAKEVGERTTTSKTYIRDIFVSKYVKKRANGICDLCGKKAPFKDKHGEPYLESHHVEHLSKGGKDSIRNTCALDPNCHRRVHILEDPKDIEILKRKLKEYEEAGE